MAKFNLVFECEVCGERFEIEYDFPVNKVQTALNVVKKLWKSDARNVYKRQMKRITSDVEAHVATHAAENRQGIYVSPIDPPAWLAFGCDKCDYVILVGENDWEYVREQIRQHAATHRMCKIFPFIPVLV